MPRNQSKAHEIEVQRSWLPSFTVVILVLTLASIVLLGLLGDSDSKNDVQAKETPATKIELKQAGAGR